MVRSGAVGPYGGATYQDGIHLNFASGNTTSGYYVKAVGAAPTVSPLTSLFTFTGGNQSMYMGPAGLLVASATNTPRIEYDASGNCLGLLMEASRTNLALQSQTFDNAAWTNTQASVSANAATAPDGTQTADTIIEDGSTNVHGNRVTTDITIVSNSTNTLSLYVKAAGRTVAYLKLSGTTDANGVAGTFDLSAVTATPTNFGTGSGGTASIQALPNGWFRCVITGAINNAETLARPRLRIFNGAESYAGDGASGLYFWGAQVEAGAFPSSYIPTTTVSVARTADSCIRTLGSEFSATAGTVVVHGRASAGQDAANQFVYSFFGTNSILFLRPAASDIARFNPFTGPAQGPLDGTFTNATAFKAAMTYATNDLALSFNGAAVVTDATATLGSYTSLSIGSEGTPALQMNGHIRRFDYWPERKTNAFLVSAST